LHGIFAQQSFKNCQIWLLTFQAFSRKRFVRCGRDFPGKTAAVQFPWHAQAGNRSIYRYVAIFAWCKKEYYNRFCAAAQNRL
jgi:hypothetical protein